MENLRPKPFWLIVKHESCHMNVLTICLAGGEKAVPVFSFEEEARIFDKLAALDDWRVRETSPGELISILFGPYSSIGWVTLDPLPGGDAELLTELMSIRRKAFIEFYLSWQKLKWSSDKQPALSPG